jgi:ParB-like chromosome segregation protein Spo0J
MSKAKRPAAKSEAGPGTAVEVVSVDSLLPDVANVRIHGDRNRAAIAGSLRRFGAARSIVVDSKGIVRAGNGTLEAAQAAGIDKAIIVDASGDELIVVRRKDWSDTEATAYAIADNRASELADWHDRALAEQLKALQSDDFDLDAVGFSDEELVGLLGRLTGEVVDDPAGEWGGMPEFKNEDQTSQFRAIVHFANEADMRAFEELVGQKLPANTRAIWYPKADRQVVRGAGYVSDEP